MALLVPESVLYWHVTPKLPGQTTPRPSTQQQLIIYKYPMQHLVHPVTLLQTQSLFNYLLQKLPNLLPPYVIQSNWQILVMQRQKFFNIQLHHSVLHSLVHYLQTLSSPNVTLTHPLKEYIRVQNSGVEHFKYICYQVKRNSSTKR